MDRKNLLFATLWCVDGLRLFFKMRKVNMNNNIKEVKRAKHFLNICLLHHNICIYKEISVFSASLVVLKQKIKTNKNGIMLRKQLKPVVSKDFIC